MTTTVILPQPGKYQLMPAMTPEQRADLKDDIKRNGVTVPIETDEANNIIDGHHRFELWAELIEEGVDLPIPDTIQRKYATEEDKIERAVALNIKRRDLTREQRQELVVKLRMPPYSFTMARIAQAVGVSIKTISVDIADLPEEAKQELMSVERVSSDGRVFSDAYAPRMQYQTGERQLLKLQTQTASTTETDAVAQPTRTEELSDKWRVQPGDVWLLPSKTKEGAVHRLMCGSVLDERQLDTLLDQRAPRLIVTSPPYNQEISTFKPSGMQLENTAFVDRMANAYSDALPEDEYQNQQLLMFELLHQRSAGDASFFYNHKNRVRDGVVLSPQQWVCGERQPDWLLRLEIIWDRSSSMTLNARMFIPCDERIYWLVKEPGKFHFNDLPEIKAYTTVWRFAARNEEHVSAPFPNELPRRCILACSEVGDLVFDPYNGTGTTMAEAEAARRTGYGMELNPAYVAVTLERMSRMGLEPVRA